MRATYNTCLFSALVAATLLLSPSLACAEEATPAVEKSGSETAAAAATANRHAPFTERDFIAMAMDKPAKEVLAAVGEPDETQGDPAGMQTWIYRDLVLKPKQQTTFHFTQLVVSKGQVVQIGHSQVDPLQP